MSERPSSPLIPSDGVYRYFRRHYPDRSAMLARAGFRRDHAASLRLLVAMELPLGAATILDFGCGDGRFLAELIATANLDAVDLPAVTLEDISERAVAQAAVALSAYANSVTTRLLSPTDEPFADVHDIVLAIGVLDYLPAWRDALVDLACRARSELLFTMPERRPLTHLMRGVWLAVHGLRASTTTVSELDRLSPRLGGKLTVTTTGRTLYGRLARS